MTSINRLNYLALRRSGKVYLKVKAQQENVGGVSVGASLTHGGVVNVWGWV